MSQKSITALWALAFVASIIMANWAIGHWGFVGIGFGLTAPAGVYFAAFTLTARDGLREVGGKRMILVAIALGAALSYFLEDVEKIAIASGVAFAISETADSLVYERIRGKSKVLGLLVSNTVGTIVDSSIFLWLAFGSFNSLDGLVVGKSYMTLAALAAILFWRSARDLPLWRSQPTSGE